MRRLRRNKQGLVHSVFRKCRIRFIRRQPQAESRSSCKFYSNILQEFSELYHLAGVTSRKDEAWRLAACQRALLCGVTNPVIVGLFSRLGWITGDCSSIWRTTGTA